MKKILALLAFFVIAFSSDLHTQENNQTTTQVRTMSQTLENFWHSTGLYSLTHSKEGLLDHSGHEISSFNQTWGKIIMIAISMLLFYLAIVKGFEPLLLIPIGFGGLLTNIPIADIGGPNGVLGIIFNFGISTGLFPILIFMGIGAMTDFGALLANPKTALLGGAAQFAIFGTLVGGAMLTHYGVIDFTLKEAAAISIIGGADGPTSIFIATRLAPDMLGAIAVAAYSYMALVPVIQPPIMRALTTKEERAIKMPQLRSVSKLEKMIFPLSALVLSILVLPDATPLIGAFMFGNFIKESGVANRLSDTLQNALINIVTIFLGLAVGTKLAAEKFLIPETLGILSLGLVAFSLGTATGVLMAKFMNLFSKEKINPLIGAAGVSAVPMSARVAQKVAMEENPSNMILMHAMGPNVSGVIGSAVAAGILISIFG